MPSQRAIHNVRFSSFGARQDTLSMDALSAVVHLAHKYQIDQLLTQALTHLMEYYTDDFDEWIRADRQVCLDPTDTDAISAINIARLTNAPSVLPLAFLHVSRVGAAVLNGCKRGCGCHVEALALQDIQRAIDGRARVHKLIGVAVARIFCPEASTTCMNSRACAAAFTRKARKLSELLEEALDDGTLTTCWSEEFEGASFPTGWEVCDRCRVMVQARERAERKAFWNALPKAFDLDIKDWET